MIRLTHVRSAAEATRWLQNHRLDLVDTMPVLVFCVSEGHDALRTACREAGYDGGAFYLDATSDVPMDGPQVIQHDLVLLPDAGDLCGALPFLARVQDAKRLLPVLWVEDREEPRWDWLASRVNEQAVLV